MVLHTAGDDDCSPYFAPDPTTRVNQCPTVLHHQRNYSCGSFPAAFSTDVGLSDSIPDSVHLVMTYAAGNMTSAQTVDVLDSYVKAVYDSSTGNDNTPFACDAGGLATLVDCEHRATATAAGLLEGGVRAVTLAGAFVPVPWVTGGKVLAMEEVAEFYSKKDFRDMAELGVNTVVMPVPCRAFSSKGEVAETVSRMLERAEGAGLKAIIVLVDEGKRSGDASMMEEHVGAAASFAASSASVIALQLPPSPIPSLADVARSAAPGLKLLVPTSKERINRIDRRSLPEDGNVFAALELGYHESVANVASSDSLSDRMKMFYREFQMSSDYLRLLNRARLLTSPVSISISLANFDFYTQTRVSYGEFRNWSDSLRPWH